MSPNGRRGVLRLRRLLRERLGEAVPGSKWETRLKQLLRDNGLPPPAAQFEIFAADGRLVGRPDLVYPRAKLFIEFDGYAFHSSRIAWEDGIARQNELVGLGYRPLRVTKRQMERAPERIVELISGRLIAAGGN
jgi:very-short-patch-repair endonuclease